MTTKPDPLQLIANVLAESPSARALILTWAAKLEGTGPDPTRACPACSADNPMEAPFCLECGLDVDAEHPHHWFCVKCGQRNGPKSIACWRHGCHLERKSGQGEGPDPYSGNKIPQSPALIDPKPGFVCPSCGQLNGPSHNQICGRCERVWESSGPDSE